MEKWSITAWVAAGLFMLAITIVAWVGMNEEALRSYVRASAQVSVVLFLLAFSASSLHTLFRRTGSAWLLRNRKYLGLSFALSHTTHFGALILLAVYFPHPFVDRLNTLTIVGGLLAYVIIVLMSVTSFAAPRRAIGERGWKGLHLIGSYYLWLLFAQSYLPRAWNDPSYLPFVLAIFLVLGLRIARFYKRATRPAGNDAII